MPKIVREGLPISPLLPQYCETLVTCVQCTAQYYVLASDVTTVASSDDSRWVYHPGVPGYLPAYIQGKCPFCAWPSVTIDVNGAVDQTVVGTAGTASDLWLWPQTAHLAGAHLYLTNQPLVIAVGVDGSNQELPTATGAPGLVWAIGRATAGGRIVIGLSWRVQTPHAPIDSAAAALLDADLLATLARNNVPIIGR